MQLPVKYVPKQSQHLGNVVGAVIIILFGLVFMSSYLPDRAAVESAKMSFGEWLGCRFFWSQSRCCCSGWWRSRFP
jgi:hypothetical protein